MIHVEEEQAVVLEKPSRVAQRARQVVDAEKVIQAVVQRRDPPEPLLISGPDFEGTDRVE